MDYLLSVFVINGCLLELPRKEDCLLYMLGGQQHQPVQQQAWLPVVDTNREAWAIWSLFVG